MDDPLGLRNVDTPSVIRAEQAAPIVEVSQLHRRLTGSYTGDSMETRLVLIAHLVYFAYKDLKEHIAR